MKKILTILFASILILSQHALAQSKSDTDHLQKAASRQLELAVQKQEQAMELHKAAMQKLHEAMALQEAAAQNQQRMIGKQKEAMVKQQELMQEQQQRLKEQEHVMGVLKAALLKDGLIQKGQPYELLLNNRALFINGKRQPDAMHQKYIQLLNQERRKPFGSSEEWQFSDTSN